MPTVLGYAAALTAVAAFAVPVLALPALVLGVTTYYTAATCALL